MRATSPRRCGGCAAGSKGAFTLVAVHADEPGRRGRRPPQLAAGRRASATGENFLASDVAAFIAHTRDADRARPGPGRRAAPGRRHGHRLRRRRRPRSARTTSTGTRRPPRRAATTTSCSRRSPSSRKAVADTLLGRIDAAGLLTLDEVRISDDELREVDKIDHRRLRHRVPRRADREVRDRALDPDARARSSWRASSATATRSWTAHTLVVAISQSGETMDTLMALRHAREQGAEVLAICNTNGSTIPRESDAVLYTHAGPEVAVASTKAFLTQLVACYLRRALPRPGARHQVRRRDPRRWSASCPHMPRKVEQVLETMEPVRELARSLRRREHRAVPRPPRRLPGGAGGRAQAQGAGLHARRGLRRGRAQARPDRADRGGAAGRRRRAVAARAVACCTTRSSPTSRRSGPAAPARSSSPRRATRPSSPYADTLIRMPAHARRCCSRWSRRCRCRSSPASWRRRAGHDVDQPRNLAKSVTVE